MLPCTPLASGEAPTPSHVEETPLPPSLTTFALVLAHISFSKFSPQMNAVSSVLVLFPAFTPSQVLLPASFPRNPLWEGFLPPPGSPVPSRGNHSLPQSCSVLSPRSFYQPSRIGGRVHIHPLQALNSSRLRSRFPYSSGPGACLASARAGRRALANE